MVALSLVFRFYSVEGKTISGARGKRLYVVAGRKDGGNGTGRDIGVSSGRKAFAVEPPLPRGERGSVPG